MDLADWERWLDQHTGSARERGPVRLLINGEQFYPVFEERLAGAARSIVPPKSIRRYLEDGSQAKVRLFLNPFATADRRKVFVIDGRYAYLGGMNLGREYRYEWHDLMAEIEGPVVASLQQEFDKCWAHAGALGDLAFAERALFGKRPQVALTNRSHFMDLRRLCTKTGHRQIRRAELECLGRARNHVFLENPYLYDNAVIVALVRARLRGVDVRVVLPVENDLSGGEGSNLVTANYLLRHGVRVYFYPGMTHVKALLADSLLNQFQPQLRRPSAPPSAPLDKPDAPDGWLHHRR